MPRSVWNEVVSCRTKRFNNYKVSTLCIDDHHFREEELKSVGYFFRSMFSNCSDMFQLGPYWTTRCSMVSEQICTNDHKMDQRAWQKIISFDLLHSSYMCLQNDIFMWETLQSNADWANTQTHTKGMRRQRRHTRKERERERQRKHARTVRERAAKTHDRERYETGDNPSLTITTSVHDLVVFFTECLMCGRNQELHLPRERWHQTVSFSKMCMCPYLRFWVKCWIRSSPRRRSA